MRLFLFFNVLCAFLARGVVLWHQKWEIHVWCVLVRVPYSYLTANYSRNISLIKRFIILSMIPWFSIIFKSNDLEMVFAMSKKKFISSDSSDIIQWMREKSLNVTSQLSPFLFWTFLRFGDFVDSHEFRKHFAKEENDRKNNRDTMMLNNIKPFFSGSVRIYVIQRCSMSMSLVSDFDCLSPLAPARLHFVFFLYFFLCFYNCSSFRESNLNFMQE